MSAGPRGLWSPALLAVYTGGKRRVVSEQAARKLNQKNLKRSQILPMGGVSTEQSEG